MVRQRVRIRFGKGEDLRLIGHRDLARLMERLFRRVGLRLGMSEGFHPKPRMAFPSALAVGIEGLNEILEMELAQVCTAEDLLGRLRSKSVSGLMFHSVEVLPPGSRKARLHRLSYQMPIPNDRRADVADGAAQLTDSPSCTVQRPGRQTPLELHRSLEDLALVGDVLSMRFRATGEASAGPRDVLSLLGLAELEQEGYFLRRTAVEVQS